MKVLFRKKFRREYKKLNLKLQRTVDEKIRLFIAGPKNKMLNNHALIGKYQGYRSINISGDLRAVYKEISEEEIIFITIGTHSQLYG
ncbi:MAG: type II toxin-antitoxin system mRNA interferase toxin, RelE/StbE family [Candidatus Berkelbacteria bacterium]|nr:type II toxin-antitoxin system mRNA interferase toxin, RelE/StbE family [Candidatus Berkelbacteria bacterium]